MKTKQPAERREADYRLSKWMLKNMEQFLTPDESETIWTELLSFYEELPTRLHISIDISVEEGGEDADKGLLAKASIAAMKKEDPMIERLHEAVEMLRPDQRELYRRIVMEEESMVRVAMEMGLDSSVIRHRMKAIRKKIKENF